jgi:hypothetical protein
MLALRSLPVAALLAASFVLASAFVGGCASGAAGSSSSSSSAAASTEYYYGTSSTTSPDGKIAYSPPVMTLVRREILPAEKRIVETAVREGRSLVTTLERVEEGRFAAHSSDASFDGIVEFEGTEWRWAGWKYSLELPDGGGRIEGNGKIDGKWLEADRFFVSGSGERRARVTDRLARITAEEFERRYEEMMKPTSSPAGKRR